MSSGACAPRSARACIRSSEVGSAQCRSSNASTTGCDRAPARNHVVSAASCRRRNSSGASFAARSVGRGMSTSGASRGAYSEASRPMSRSVFSRSARRRSAGSSAPKRWRPHSAIGCNGVFCKSCDDDSSTKVCGVSAKRRAKLLHKTRLADARLADDERELARAIARPLPAPAQQVELLLAPDERGERPRAGAPRRRSRARCGRASPAPARP